MRLDFWQRPGNTALSLCLIGGSLLFAFSVMTFITAHFMHLRSATLPRKVAASHGTALLSASGEYEDLPSQKTRACGKDEVWSKIRNWAIVGTFVVAAILCGLALVCLYTDIDYTHSQPDLEMVRVQGEVPPSEDPPLGAFSGIGEAHTRVHRNKRSWWPWSSAEKETTTTTTLDPYSDYGVDSRGNTYRKTWLTKLRDIMNAGNPDPKRTDEIFLKGSNEPITNNFLKDAVEKPRNHTRLAQDS